MAPVTGRTALADGLKSIIVCVDSYDDLLMQGAVFHGSFSGGKKYTGLMQLIIIIEDILDSTGFPKAVSEKRRFNDNVRPVKPFESIGARADDIKTGKSATLILKILFRHNADWQGSVAWIEGGSEINFRSTLELLSLMDNALR